MTTIKRSFGPDSDSLEEEIAWLRTFHYSNERIAARLGITVDTIEQRDRRRK
jgi:DNA-binding CsgD family transcriptional regulator